MLAATGIESRSFSTRVDYLIHYSTRTLKQSQRKNRGFIKLKGVKMPCLMPIRVKKTVAQSSFLSEVLSFLLLEEMRIAQLFSLARIWSSLE